MTTKVETTVRQWSTPVQKVVEGQPPRPEDNPTTITGESRRADIRTITPNYKYGTEKSSYEMKFGSSTNLPEAVGDYKVKETQDHFKLQIIDPKVVSNANMPASSGTVPAAYHRNIDFPSEHSKRSFLKLEPMEQRKIRSTQTRPITTSAYLTESLDRHREMEASRLKEYLRAKESDANKPWNKPDWPASKGRQDNEESIRELEEIRKTIESLQKVTSEQKKDVSSATWQFSAQSFSPRSVVSINGGTKADDGLLKVRTDLSPLSRTISRSNAAVQTAHITESEKQPWPYMPAQLGQVADSPRSTMTREYNENYSKKIDRYASLPTLDTYDARGGTLIKIQDDKPRGIMKRRELETKDQMMYANNHHPNNLLTQRREIIQTKPKVTETVQKFEEHKRTEEIERRIQRKERKEKKHRSSRHHGYYHGGGGQDMLGYSDGEEIIRRRQMYRDENERNEFARGFEETREEDYRHRAEQLKRMNEENRRRFEEDRLHEQQKRFEYEKRKYEEEKRRNELERIRLNEQKRRNELRPSSNLVKERTTSERLQINKRTTSLNDVSQQSKSRSKSLTRIPVEHVQRIYQRRQFSPSELNEAVRNAYKAVDQAHRDISYRSSSLSRNGYLPSHESYTRTVTTRREKDGRYSDDGRYQTNNSTANRYYGGSSISDSLRRGDVKYNPNGEIRQVHNHNTASRNGRVHKSDIFDSGYYDDRRSLSSRNYSTYNNQPLIEFPPTLPRSEHQPPMPPPHRNRSVSNDFYKPLSKSRSCADWDDSRSFTHQIRRRDDDMKRLENEFRDSLLMPLPNNANLNNNGNVYERDYRREQIPGGYEAYDREIKSNSGRRLNRDGNPTHFNESSQEYSYKREQESDRRR